MITIRIANSKIFNYAARPSLTYTFYCPSCSNLIMQFDCERTPFHCRGCGKPLQDIRRMMEDPATRIMWHSSEQQYWEDKEQ